MLARLRQEMNEAVSGPVPLSTKEMTRLGELTVNKNQETAEEKNERMLLQCKQDAFLTNFDISELDTKKEEANVKEEENKLHKLSRRAWVVAAAFLALSFGFPKYAYFLLWVAALMLRAQIAGWMVFEGGFSARKIVAAVVTELGLPFYCWRNAGDLPWGGKLLLFDLFVFGVFWLTVVLVVLDAYRLDVVKKNSNNKGGKKRNKKKKRS